MITRGKAFAVHGVGNPLVSPELLLVTMLVELGYPIYENEQGERTAFQDITKAADGSRRWVFAFKGAGELEFPDGEKFLVKDCADQIRGDAEPKCKELAFRAKIYKAYQPGKAPLKALKALLFAGDDVDRIVEQHGIALREIKAARRHVEIYQNGRSYFVFHDLTAEEQAAEIAKIDRA